MNSIELRCTIGEIVQLRAIGSHMAIVKTSSKGQIVIPAEIREKIGLKPGGKVLVTLSAGKVTIEPLPEDPVDAAWGMLAGGPSLTAALRAEKRGERAREEEKTGPRQLRAARLPRKRAGRR